MEQMKCDFCQADFKDEFLSKVIIDEGEKVMLCNGCEDNLIESNM
jgi:hypothetical protein